MRRNVFEDWKYNFLSSIQSFVNKWSPGLLGLEADSQSEGQIPAPDGHFHINLQTSLYWMIKKNENKRKRGRVGPLKQEPLVVAPKRLNGLINHSQCYDRLLQQQPQQVVFLQSNHPLFLFTIQKRGMGRSIINLSLQSLTRVMEYLYRNFT